MGKILDDAIKVDKDDDEDNNDKLDVGTFTKASTLPPWGVVSFDPQTGVEDYVDIVPLEEQNHVRSHCSFISLW